MSAAPSAFALRLQHLRASIAGLNSLGLETPRALLPTALDALDRMLAGGGLPLGSFVEILSAKDEACGYSLALLLARTALARRPAWVVVDAGGTFYPPASAALGFALERLILIRPPADDDAWAFTQVLRAPDIAVCFWATERMDDMLFRRLQLAAERGGGLGFVLRPPSAERKPCWAGLRLHAEWVPAAPRPRLSVRVLHASGRFVDAECRVEFDA